MCIRDRIYSNTTKVLVDTKQGSNLLYLPLDKIIQQTNVGNAMANTPAADATSTNPNTVNTAPASGDARARDGRSRDRDGR